jgi:hypothetical protein
MAALMVALMSALLLAWMQCGRGIAEKGQT